MNKEQQELLDEVYEKYSIIAGMSTQVITITKEEFIRYIKTDVIFSKQWGLKIEERELSLEERYDWFIKTYNTNLTRSGNQYDMEDILNSNNCPTKLITITYNNKPITSYE